MRSVLILKSLTLGTVTSHPQSRVFSHLLKEKIMAIGTVKWFNNEKGYGFIAPSDGAADVFAHYSAITSNGYRTLEENQQVEFDVTQGPKGPQAENIRPL
jgi:CspA family cold shock protein